jgi:hypothetical protein
MVRDSSIMGTNPMVRECKGEVGKYLTNTVERLFRK